MGFHVWQDYDLCREAAEDRRRDEPDERELDAARADIMAGELERAGMPVGTRIAGKDAA